MHSKFALTAIAAAMVFASSFVQSAEIYPVDKARFMTNARFDFKVELDNIVDRNDIKIEINGADYRKVLTGDEIFVGEEIDAKASAVLMRDVEIKKPGTYKVTVSGKGGNKTVVWNTYDTPKKRQAKNVILLLADGLSVGHRTAARIMSKGVVNGMYNAPLAMDDMPNMALLGTSSVDTIAADSANTASAYMTGHKSSVNALGVYVDRTKATQDDPRQETIAELIRRTLNSKTLLPLQSFHTPAAERTKPISWACSTTSSPRSCSAAALPISFQSPPQAPSAKTISTTLISFRKPVMTS